jgi:hypothetical protein
MVEDKIELNLENPIFALYVDIQNMSPQKANKYFEDVKKTFYIYNNVTTWIIGSNVNKVECVYDGKSKIRIEELNNLIEELNTRIDVLSNSNSYDDFKMNIRDWRLNKVYEKNGTEKE